MSQGNQSYLRFSLEEAVWFQRGQEVEELVSISLDPNITIQENDQYVTIRGSLDLTGEYKGQLENIEEDNQWSVVQKWVQHVEEREEGVREFTHQFPVDITIPSYRVRDLSEIDVLIDTFDYVLPERSCLKLTAELNITGLYGEQVAYEEQEEFEYAHRNPLDEYAEEIELSEETEDEADYQPFEVEARRKDPFFAEPAYGESSSYQLTPPNIHYDVYRSENPHPGAEPAPYLSQQGATAPVTSEEEKPVEESHESPSFMEKLMKKKQANKKSMSISEFLARKEGDEHARLKVCIVQQGESIDTLAERYDVSVQQLQKVNNLEINQDVSEGQVLYVPQVTSKR